MAMDLWKKRLTESSDFKKSVAALYHGQTVEAAAERYAKLIDRHLSNNAGDVRVFSSPGRIEVIGNHTDHNNGKVVCAAVTIDTLAAVTVRDDNVITVDSEGFPIVRVSTDDLQVNEKEFGTSEALIRGIVKGMKDRGYKVGGFDASTVTNVFKGAGVSSSAAFEVLAVEILNVLYNGGKMTKIEKAIVAQYAENVYFGKPSGLMDQSAIALGNVSYIDFENLSDPKVKTLSWDFDDVDIVIVNCGGDHCNLTPNYAAIRSEMESVAAFFGKKVLREVPEERMHAEIAGLKSAVPGRAVLRAFHYYEENGRVERLASALEEKRESDALGIIAESGNSSWKLLQNCYPEGQNEEPIPLALSIAERTAGVRAARVHGGGFAGTVLMVVDNGKTADIVGKFAALYGAENVFVLGIRAEGTTEVKF